MVAESLPDRFTVRVLATDIRAGSRADAWKCPLALALTRKIGDAASVTYGFVGLRGGIKYLHDAERFLDRFDRTGRASPVTVTLTRLVHDHA
jgi:hypothetical protein